MKNWAALALLTAPTAATAQDSPRFCPNNPSLESSACTTEPGRVQIETNIADWQVDSDHQRRVDTVAFADTLVRIGIVDTSELQIEWTPYGRQRERVGHAVDRQGGAGDVTIAWRQNLRNPDGSGLSYGVQPFVTLPVGRSPIGQGDWGAGVIAPITYDLTKAINIGFTGEVDATPDQDGHGRHFSTNGVAAVSIDVTDQLSATLETELLRDDDPAGATTQALAGLGLTLEVAPTRAIYAEAVGGLNRDAPDFRLYAGVAAVF